MGKAWDDPEYRNGWICIQAMGVYAQFSHFVTISLPGLFQTSGDVKPQGSLNVERKEASLTHLHRPHTEALDESAEPKRKSGTGSGKVAVGQEHS